MSFEILPEDLIQFGFTEKEIRFIIKKINVCIKTLKPKDAWQKISQEMLLPPPRNQQNSNEKISYCFPFHLYLFNLLFPDWQNHPEFSPAYIPDSKTIANTHLHQWMQRLHCVTIGELHRFSVRHQNEFYSKMLAQLNIKFISEPSQMVDLKEGVEKPNWFPNALLNIVDSCLQADPQKTALYYNHPTENNNYLNENENPINKNENRRNENDDRANKRKLQSITYGELNTLVNQIANSLVNFGIKAHDRVAIVMNMNAHAVAAYLAIIKMGGVVVSIADSFSADEISTRLKIAETKAVITQDGFFRGDKPIYLYEKMKLANAPACIILQSLGLSSLAKKFTQGLSTQDLREGDIFWSEFLVNATRDLSSETHDFSSKTMSDSGFPSFQCTPMSYCNILFSSGTTGTPKAIPWNHSTAIKAAIDAHLHHNIHPDDILCWPTSLGWMMGPWLIFAALINQSAIALYDGLPHSENFGKFVEEAGVTMLGVVPTLVAHWRQHQTMEKFNWEKIRLFSSTGECSNAEDMFYLMSLAGYKPVIEYCGGTEIGGAYITSTVIEENYPSLLTTPAFGNDFMLLPNAESTDNHATTDNHARSDNHATSCIGEVALIPPSLGLSTELLNGDHHKTYYTGMPVLQDGTVLRRHGDQLRQYSNGLYSVLGRVDDTMNLGGIKISAAEIERVLVGINAIEETAAIGIQSKKGPAQLVIYAVSSSKMDSSALKKKMQERINQHLNPLFKIQDVIIIPSLPKTASNKIMRRVLRQEYENMKIG